MKFVEVLFVICVAVSFVKAEELNRAKIQEYAKGCKEEVGASEDDLANLFKHEPSATHSEKCLRACLMEKLEVINGLGHVNKERARETIAHLEHDNPNKEKLMNELVDACANIEVPADRCEAAEAYQVCMIKFVKEKKLASK